MTDDDDPTLWDEDGPDESLLADLADRGEFDVDVSGADARAASDGLDVDTPAGRLRFEVPPVADYGGSHERHDPADGVHVNRWFHDGYAVIHVHDVDADAHTVLVREQYPDERAMELRDHGVPERRAEIVALRERGLSYGDIVEATGDRGPNHRGDVSKHLRKFNAQVRDAKWLARNADAVEMGS
ncbi:hypothetical protein [Halostella salina]|uniref:hypothetical protein n=1 Tax=Halostella salina TaxID=1547897 RepID=UPI000EF7FCF3|nr:hypothetical protein [Halostella salina]